MNLNIPNFSIVIWSFIHKNRRNFITHFFIFIKKKPPPLKNSFKANPTPFECRIIFLNSLFFLILYRKKEIFVIKALLVHKYLKKLFFIIVDNNEALV